MAKITNIQSRMEKVMVEKEVSKKAISLELSAEEAFALLLVTGHITGSSKSFRFHTDNIYNVLRSIVIPGSYDRRQWLSNMNVNLDFKDGVPENCSSYFKI